MLTWIEIGLVFILITPTFARRAEERSVITSRLSGIQSRESRV